MQPQKRWTKEEIRKNKQTVAIGQDRTRQAIAAQQQNTGLEYINDYSNAAQYF